MLFSVNITFLFLKVPESCITKTSHHKGALISFFLLNKYQITGIPKNLIRKDGIELIISTL